MKRNSYAESGLRPASRKNKNLVIGKISHRVFVYTSQNQKKSEIIIIEFVDQTQVATSSGILKNQTKKLLDNGLHIRRRHMRM